MSQKSNGDVLEGAIAVPVNYPNPVDQNVNMHSMSWAYGVGNKTMDKTAPTAAVLSISSGTAKTVSLSWTASGDGQGSGMDHYELWDGGVAVFAPIALNVHSYSHTDTTGTAHTFVLKSVDGAGNVASSNTVTVTTV